MRQWKQRNSIGITFVDLRPSLELICILACYLSGYCIEVDRAYCYGLGACNQPGNVNVKCNSPAACKPVPSRIAFACSLRVPGVCNGG